MKTIIIDGNNLLHQAGDFARRSGSRREALAEAVRSRLPKSVKIVFFFDGEGKSSSGDIIFSGKRTSDELIREYIEKAVKPSGLTVVSSDRYISSLAEKCSCTTKNSKEFWNEINPAAGSNGMNSQKNINQNYIYDKLEKPERMSRKEIDEFRKYFS